MELKVYRHAVELGKPPFGKAPERLDPVDVAMAVTGEFMLTVVHPKMPGMADIHQAVVTPPAIAVDDALNRHLAQYDRLQSQALTVWDDLRINTPNTGCFSVPRPRLSLPWQPRCRLAPK